MTILVLVFVAAAGGLFIAVSRIDPALKARNSVEGVMKALLLAASIISIITTIGIVLSVLFESFNFFGKEGVSIKEFLTGTNWSPGGSFYKAAGREETGSEAHFGAVPLFAGTFMITGIAMLVAVPLGVLAAVYMSEYASKGVRGIAKPLLEILAGIPTVGLWVFRRDHSFSVSR